MIYNDCYLHSVTSGECAGQFDDHLKKPNFDDYWDMSAVILKRIELINKFGILSLNMQKKYVGKIFSRCVANWNGADYISLSDPTIYIPRYALDRDNDDLTSFNNKYLSMSFLISRDIDKYLEFRKSYRRMEYEVQVKDMIPREFIIGLRVPSAYTKDGCCSDEEYLDAIKFRDTQEVLNVWQENITFLQRYFEGKMDIPLVASITGEVIPSQLVRK